MKQKMLIVMFAVFAIIARGQTTPLSLISSSGGIGSATIAGSPKIVEWTIGEVFIGGGAANNQSISIGEQQSTHIGVGISETYFSQVKVYPNPASSYVKIDNMPAGNKTIELMDINGRIVRSLATSENYQSISTGSLATGTYTLTLKDGGNNQITYKISITNN